MRHGPTPDHVVLVSFRESGEVFNEARRVLPRLYALPMWMPPRSRAKLYRTPDGNWELAVPRDFTEEPELEVIYGLPHTHVREARYMRGSVWQVDYTS